MKSDKENNQKQIRTKGLRISNNVVTKYLGEEDDVIVPEGVTKIGAKAFYRTRIRSISLPQTLESIGKEAFANNKLESLAIPPNVNEIDVSAFDNAFEYFSDNGLSVDPDNETYKCKDSILYSADETIIYWADYRHKFEDLIIPASVKDIKPRAFEGCYIKTIKANSYLKIGERAFDNCHGLSSAIFPEGALFIGEKVINPGLFSKEADYYIVINPDAYIGRCQLDKEKEALLRGYAVAFEEGIIYPAEVEKYTNQYIKNHFKLTKKYYYKMPEYRRMILGKKLLTREQAEELVDQCDQQGLTEERAELLNYINTSFPKETVEKKTERILNKDPYAPKVMKENWSYTKLPDGTIKLTGYKGSESEVRVPPRIGKNIVTVIGSQAFCKKYGNKEPEWRKTCGQTIESIVLPDSIKEVGWRAFMSCGKLNNVELNEGLEDLEGGAFLGCTSLKELHLPESLFLQFIDSDTKELTVPEYGSDIDRILYERKITLLCKHGSLAEQYALKRGYPIKYI